MTARRVDLAPGDDILRVVADHPGIDLILVVRPGRDALGHALVEAAVGPLAVAAAPVARINAIMVGDGADEAAVTAAAAYLAAAHAVTGQLLAIGT